MPIKAVAFSDAQEVHWGSDIESLRYDGPILVIVVARDPLPEGKTRGLEITFGSATAIRLLDELQIARYWTSKEFPFGHHVVEVLEGGWSDEESQLQGYATARREWLVVTGNGCVSVFSASEPIVKEVVYEAIA
jgi:hypothetical protein